MNLAEFQNGIARLQSVYSERAYPQERVDIIFRNLGRYITVDVWEEAVAELIAESQHAPMLSKIKESVYAVRRRRGQSGDAWQNVRNEIAKISEAGEQCSRCLNSGVFSAVRRTDPNQYQYCFICDCRAGDLAARLPENKNKIRQWNLSMNLDWRPEFECDSPSETARTRQEARAAARTAITSTDLNTAIDRKAGPYRGYDDSAWDADL